MKVCLQIFCLIIAFFSIHSSFANLTELSHPKYFIDSTKNRSLDDFLKIEDKKLFDSPEYFAKYDYNVHWVEHFFSVDTDEKYRISIKFQTINSLEIFLLNQENQVIKTYRSSNFNLKLFKNTSSGYFEFFAPLQKNVPYKLVVKAHNQISSFKLPIEITPKSEVASANNRFFMTWLFVFGIVFILSIVSLMVFAIIKNTIFMYYGLFIFTYGVWIASYHGLIPFNFTPLFSGFYHYDQFIFFGFFFVIFYLNFSLEYLKEAEFKSTPYIRKWVNIYLIIQFFICCFYFPESDIIKKIMVFSYNFIMILIIAYLIAILARGLLQKRIMAYFYLIAVLPMFLLFGYHRIAKILNLNYHNSMDKYFLFAMLFEAIWMIFGIIYQLKKLSDNQRQLQTENLKYQEEKLQLSREIHDSIGSQFTIIKKSLEEIEKETSKKDKILNLHGFVASSIKDLQNSIWTLNKEKNIQLMEVNLRLLDTIAFLKNAQDEIKIIYKTEGNFEIAVDSLFCINLFRVINEFVNNSIKHAACTEISIKIISKTDELQIFLRDNGKGFDIKTVSLGNGIKNMLHRMEKNGAEINLKSDQYGTTMEILKKVK